MSSSGSESGSDKAAKDGTMTPGEAATMRARVGARAREVQAELDGLRDRLPSDFAAALLLKIQAARHALDVHAAARDAKKDDYDGLLHELEQAAKAGKRHVQQHFANKAWTSDAKSPRERLGG
ncbi:hypothetical protein Q5752_000394 [Cryptotrichosporon argae]